MHLTKFIYKNLTHLHENNMTIHEKIMVYLILIEFFSMQLLFVTSEVLNITKYQF